MRECLLSAAIVMLVAPGLPAGSATPFTLGEQGGIIVPVRIGAAGPFLMLIDTGATHSAIVEEVAARVGAQTVANSSVISPTDTTVRRVVAARQVSIGPVTVDVLLPSVVANTAFDRHGSIQGLIGQDVLASLRYTVDFRRRVLEWHDAPIRRGGFALPLVFEHGRFLVQARNSGRALRLVPDSGAGALVLYTSGAVPASGLVEMGPVELSSSTSSVAARRVLVRELRVGSRTFRDVMAVALSGKDRLGAEGDGLLPLHLFDRVTFDGPGRLLILG
jgi:predicted aspartyl protease